tara:strand:- start:6666 stop:7097 length:432 start_codon:yes stop_codon:yes gene_type:complete
MNGQNQSDQNTNDKKCTSKIAEHYVNDLFELLEIKSQNNMLFTQMCKLLMKYNVSIIRKSWRDVVFMCELPNGQIAGKLPPLWKIENKLQSENINRFDQQHKISKTDIAPQGTIMKLWDIGKQFAKGEITEAELEILIEEMKK